MHETHRQDGLIASAAPTIAAVTAPVRCRPCVQSPTDRNAHRERMFHLVTEAVDAGLPLPSRISMAPGHRQLDLEIGDRPGWELWRTRLGCMDVTVRVYESRGAVRRSSVGRAARGGCRIAVELVEDIDIQEVRMSAWGAEGRP